MDNFIVILKDKDVLHGAGYTPMLRHLVEENKVDKIINISNPTEPRILDDSPRGSRKLFVVG